ncbi:hypothetical protein T492DRAFT_834963 [Pavlovales sp. CCMP2436]|nr:hypothetical protein T492DRAFT_834963 [Pavlovales sp. CCMP2436]
MGKAVEQAEAQEHALSHDLKAILSLRHDERAQWDLQRGELMRTIAQLHAQLQSAWAAPPHRRAEPQPARAEMMAAPYSHSREYGLAPRAAWPERGSEQEDYAYVDYERSSGRERRERRAGQAAAGAEHAHVPRAQQPREQPPQARSAYPGYPGHDGRQSEPLSDEWSDSESAYGEQGHSGGYGKQGPPAGYRGQQDRSNGYGGEQGHSGGYGEQGPVAGYRGHQDRSSGYGGQQKPPAGYGGSHALPIDHLAASAPRSYYSDGPDYAEGEGARGRGGQLPAPREPADYEEEGAGRGRGGRRSREEPKPRGRGEAAGGALVKAVSRSLECAPPERQSPPLERSRQGPGELGERWQWPGELGGALNAFPAQRQHHAGAGADSGRADIGRGDSQRADGGLGDGRSAGTGGAHRPQLPPDSHSGAGAHGDGDGASEHAKRQSAPLSRSASLFKSAFLPLPPAPLPPVPLPQSFRAQTPPLSRRPAPSSSASTPDLSRGAAKRPPGPRLVRRAEVSRTRTSTEGTGN